MQFKVLNIILQCCLSGIALAYSGIDQLLEQQGTRTAKLSEHISLTTSVGKDYSDNGRLSKLKPTIAVSY